MAVLPRQSAVAVMLNSRLFPVALTVGTAGPAAGPAHAVIKFLDGAANPALAGLLLLGAVDPADEFVARQHRDVEPGRLGGLVVCERCSKVVGQFVDLATW